MWWLPILGALSGGFARRLMGAGHEAKEKMRLGFVSNGTARIFVILLALPFVFLSDWPLWVKLLVVGLAALPWFTPKWGESVMSPLATWPKGVGFMLMWARFLVPGGIIATLTGQPYMLLASILPAVIYFFTWKIFDINNDPNAKAEVAAGASWYGALGATVGIPCSFLSNYTPMARDIISGWI